MLQCPPIHFPLGPQSETIVRANPLPTRTLRPQSRPEKGVHLPAPVQIESLPH